MAEGGDQPFEVPTEFQGMSYGPGAYPSETTSMNTMKIRKIKHKKKADKDT